MAQVSKLKIKKEKPSKVKPKKDSIIYRSHESIDIYYGYRIYQNSFYNQLNTLNDAKTNAPPQIIGVGISGHDHLVGPWALQPIITYYKIIPTKIYIEDTLNTKLSGFVFGFGLGKSLATKNKNLSISAYLGFNTGRTTLTKNEFISQKNQFFSPKITIQPKVIIKHVAISFIVEYEYDITNPAWKQTYFDKKTYLLNTFNQTTATALLSLGYRFF